MEEVKIDKRTRAYKESQEIGSEDVGSLEGVLGEQASNGALEPVVASGRLWPIGDKDIPVTVLDEAPKDYSKIEDNPNFMLCCVCGKDALEHNEDGSLKSRRHGAPCEDCIRKNYSKAVIGGREVDIDPTKPPKAHFNDDGSVSYK